MKKSMKSLSGIAAVAMLLLLAACSGEQTAQITQMRQTTQAYGGGVGNVAVTESEAGESMPQASDTVAGFPEADIKDFTYTENENGEIIITGYVGKEKDVAFPASIEGKPVVQIGFEDEAVTVVSEDTQSVFISGVEKIGDCAFANCKKLNKAIIGEGVEEICGGAFLRCKGLTEITIPNTVSVIGSMAFSESGLREIVIPKSVKTIRSGAFSRCGELTRLTISEGVEVIDSQAFCECEKLTELTLPEGIKEINLDAFRNCGIKSIALPDSLVGFEGGRTFTDCDVTYKGKTYSPELYEELYKAINGEYYVPPSMIPPAA